MLGKLAKYLRILGFDTRYERTISEKELLFNARRDERIILTRKKSLEPKEGVLFINLDDPKEQLRFLFEKLNLKDKIRPFTRCLICNEKLEEIRKEEAKGKVPYFTFATQNRFSCCPSCQRVYWPGSHLEKMRDFLKETLATEYPAP